MAICDLCGQKTDWLKSRHPACIKRAENFRRFVGEQVFDGTLGGRAFAELKPEIDEIVVALRLPEKDIKGTILQRANDAATELALREPLHEAELCRVVSILQGFGMEAHQAEWRQRRWFGMALVGLSHTLWQAFYTEVPLYDAVDRMPFNLRNGEFPVFTAGKVTFAEERSVLRNFGSISLPIAGGISYSLDSSKFLQASSLVPVDVGEMLISTQALYFGGQTTTLRIALGNVVRFKQYVDAVGVYESTEPARVFYPDCSGMDTGWFLFKLLTGLASKLASR